MNPRMCGFIEDWGKVLGMPQWVVYLREPEWVAYRREPEWVVYLRKPQWVVEMFWSRLSHKDNLLQAETVDCHHSLATLRERDKWHMFWQLELFVEWENIKTARDDSWVFCLYMARHPHLNWHILIWRSQDAVKHYCPCHLTRHLIMMTVFVLHRNW